MSSMQKLFLPLYFLLLVWLFGFCILFLMSGFDFFFLSWFFVCLVGFCGLYLGFFFNFFGTVHWLVG